MTPTAGLGFKPQHFSDAMASPAVGLWFEVHAENYMVDGGPRLAMLEELRRDRPLSLHGVGLSLGNAAEPDRDHQRAQLGFEQIRLVMLLHSTAPSSRLQHQPDNPKDFFSGP